MGAAVVAGCPLPGSNGTKICDVAAGDRRKGRRLLRDHRHVITSDVGGKAAGNLQG